MDFLGPYVSPLFKGLKCSKDVKHAKEAPPHFYITFPIKDDLTLIICIITYQFGSKPVVTKTLVQGELMHFGE